MELLRCPACRGFLWEPVTVSCGHSFCKRCLGGRELPFRCPDCRQRLRYLGVRELRCNVLLSGLLDKCLDGGTKVGRLKVDLQQLLWGKEYREVLKAAQRGLEMAPHDVFLRLVHAEAHTALQQYPEALEDLEMVCRRDPECPEGFCRKGAVLALMGKRMEALCQLCHCLKLNYNFLAARKEIEKILQLEISPLPDTTPELLQVVSQYLDQFSSGTEVLIEPLSTASVEESQETSDNRGATGDPVEADIGALRTPCQPAPPGTSSEESMKRKEPEQAEDPMEKTLSKHFKSKGAAGGDPGESTALCSVALRDQLSPADFECSLCIRMFFEPVTTPCGHTFCKECVERCLDHRPHCPLCKQSLREYLKAGKYLSTTVLQDIMAAAFPAELAERNQIHELEMVELSNLTTDIPIFVCILAFPGIPCPLHIFEPRYRLMMRRCQETGTKRFGMCIYERRKSFADFGCMLEILSLEYLPDGRSFVDTVGRRRFRVLKRGHRDGYHTADVEYLEDKKVEGEELVELRRLHDLTYQQVEQWIAEDQTDLSRQCFMNSGPLPKMEDDLQASPDGPAWCWWLLGILPLDPAYQTMILSMTSLKDRLTHMKHILSVFTQSQS